jgi:hypothetical protein
LRFFQELLDDNKSIDTLGLFRTAIGRYHSGIGGLPVSRHKKVCQFMSGAFKLNPKSLILLPSWDLCFVLDVLQGPPFEPLSEASLMLKTFKAVLLVALTTARRVSELQALGRLIGYYRREVNGIRLRTIQGFLPKTATAAHLGNDVFIPSYKKNKLICPRRAVQYYVQATEDLPGQKGTLFVAFGGKTKGSPVHKRTISGWLVKAIKLCYTLRGKELPRVKAHSTRSISTSWALFNHASYASILKAADWRSDRTFAKHYGLDLWRKEETVFGRSVLDVAGSSQN